MPQLLTQHQDSNKNMPLSKRLNETLTTKMSDSSVVAPVAKINLEAQIKNNISLGYLGQESVDGCKELLQQLFVAGEADHVMAGNIA